MANPWAIIVGAGPSGLLLALLLSRQGVPVQVVEANDDLDDRPRATHYGGPAVYELRRAGVVDDVRRQGFEPEGVQWRKLDGTYITGLSHHVLPAEDPDKMICLPLNQLGKILLSHLESQPCATISWNYKVISISQDADLAYVEVDTPAGREKLHAPYIVGCDGANSQIRRSLFGDLNFPGKTWDDNLVATNIYFDFKKHGYGDANFVIDPEHWHMAARISKDGMWRVTYGDLPNLTPEQLLARQPAKFQALLPGNPSPESGAYRVANISPYRVHQRLAERMRVGRFLLAADAAHLCNPMGGLGLTGGIVDIGGLYDCLIGIFKGLTSPAILDRYDQVRRDVYNSMINPISSSNLVRLSQDPANVLEVDEFLQMCKRGESDPDLVCEILQGVKNLSHDFTKDYDSSVKEKSSFEVEGEVVSVN
ncbi:uncharacterized protein A1O5_00915 [Cladophialophora psammophila CBS 110553]|uniref:FAD-binding domain-containing protein n=1 Tax=Cladophialophora psammophila CBS 110553 TaxID=1182543 RepID=W9X7G6_9EURO|nr:uncharacterized protein A1O5_00915 [Cladophialophora psammophila CBS 110553]EXJ76407.1 hypothetical protein A1O5_00915 [Cladophialophora psammophila CBS 110553]